jgi:chromosome segregation ATPase
LVATQEILDRSRPTVRTTPADDPPASARADLEAREQAVRQQSAELANHRQHLHERYQHRRDRLAGLHEAIRRAAVKVQERKRQLDAETEQARARQVLLASRAEKLDYDRRHLDAQLAQLDQRTRAAQEQAECQQADHQEREAKLTKEREQLEKNQAQYHSDLVRLDRMRATLEQRQQQLQDRARDIDQRFEQMQRTSRELEEQAHELDSWHNKLRAEERELTERKGELEKTTAQVNQRAAALEGQQAMFAGLRTRLERMREELRRDQQQVAEHQARLVNAEAELKRQQEEAAKLRAELDGDKQLRDEERRQFEQRQTELEAAVTQVRQVQQQQEAKARELEAQAGAQLAETRRFEEQSAQFRETHERLTADRLALRERESTLLQNERVREALQEQLRRRSEELAARQRELAELARKQADNVAQLETRRAELEDERRRAEEKYANARKEVEGQSAELGQLQTNLAQRQEQLQRHVERLKEAGRNIGAARKELSEEREQWTIARREVEAAAAQERAICETARRETAELLQQLPELELRAGAAGERLAQAREQLREHLAELHAYARQSQEDIETLRNQVHAEAEQVQQQRLELHRGRDEHRLAVAAFRQQLIEWQGQVADLKRSLAHDETRLERRQAQVDEQARQVDASSVRLAQQAEALQEQERLVVERREEMERHLDEMREWYRRKLRELSERRRSEEEANGVDGPDTTEETRASAPEEAAVVGIMEQPRPGILALTGDVEPADRQLGELLRSLNLVDGPTLTSLLVEARRQRRSLRQALLAGGYLTLYQMALIETGDLGGLVLGPLRVIDRLHITPREAVYRVFDPRRNHEAILRHVAEAEMEDAVHPDEFRQRFSQAATVQHANVAATHEVLEIAERPAVLLESLHGLPSNDWPVFVAVPGVWLKLVGQAALALRAVHQAALVHGHLGPDLLLLTQDGTVKLCGLGEPPWLSVPPLSIKDETADDLADLGRIATGWAEMATRLKGAKSRAATQPIQTLLQRLTARTDADRYAAAASLVEDIERATASVPEHHEVWERLLRYVAEHAADDSALRQSA